jgi:transcriptional regulator with GAF, ATPase, and Fis domain
MEIAQLIKDYLAIIVSWPLFALIIAILLVTTFRQEIGSFIDRLKSARVGPIDLVTAIKEEAKQSQISESKVAQDIINTIIRPLNKTIVADLARIYTTIPNTGQDIRTTVYMLWPLDTEYLVQVTPYVPAGPDKTGRLLSKRIGAVGKAFREGKVVSETMSASEFKKKHLEQWSFEEIEVERLKGDRKSYLAIPLNINDKLLGVVFFDSLNENTFDGDLVSHLQKEVQGLVTSVFVLSSQLESLRPPS